MIDRYALPEMKEIFSEENKISLWLKIELLVCKARTKRGEIPQSDLDEILSKASFSIKRIKEIENETNHDLIAFIATVSESVGPAGRHIHYGMTSSDILDTALAVQMNAAGKLILQKLAILRTLLHKRTVEHKNTFCIGRTHGVHAEPITLGLKFLNWYEEIGRDIDRIQSAVDGCAVGKISGAVGTFNYLSLDIEKFVCSELGLKPAVVSTQIIQRDRHAELLSMIALTGSSLEKIATEIRHLQRTEVLELEEPFAKSQKGSSAMPHKKNPIICERIAGLARILRGNSLAAMENISLWNERDISHSSVERIIIPDSCMLIDYMIHSMINVIEGLVIHEKTMMKNIHHTRGLIFSQMALLKLIEKGMSREEAYRIVQDAAMKVWNDNQTDLKSELLKHDKINTLLTSQEIGSIFEIKNFFNNLDSIYANANII